MEDFTLQESLESTWILKDYKLDAWLPELYHVPQKGREPQLRGKLGNFLSPLEVLPPDAPGILI